MNQSNTELAALLREMKEIDENGLYREEISFDGSGRYAVDIDAVHRLSELIDLAAALESPTPPERVQKCGNTPYDEGPFTLVAEGFPARILDMIKDMADRRPKPGRGPWEYGDGTPMQDDAEKALRWIALRASTPAERVPLSEAQIDQLWKRSDERADWSPIVEFARAIEAHHGIKESGE